MKRFTPFFALLVPAFFLISVQGRSQQNPCASGIPSQQWEDRFQELLHEAQQRSGHKTQSVVYTIPVIVHVVHGGQPVGTYPNLAQGQINAQIQALNYDYAGAGTNSGNYPQLAFSNYAVTEALPSANIDNLGRVAIANCNVQFCLAVQDTLGNTLAEPGIDRINFISRGWSNPYSFNSLTSFQNFIDRTLKPNTIWNPGKYLNIWITDENINAAGGLLGYATFPPLSGLGASIPSANAGTDTTDGVWCYAKVFGSAATYSQGTYYNTNYNKGRTATHEIGHWLGLRHIWGDGQCQDDYCGDTPAAKFANSGSPNYPYHVGTCSTTSAGSNAQDGEMFMNFMDYTNDNGKYMFTPGQADRMATALTNSPYRKLMGTHGLCSVSSIAANASFNISSVVCAGTSMALNNTSAGLPVPGYSWSATGGATFTPNANASSPSITFPSAGIYSVTLTAGNGTTSTVSRTVHVNAQPNLVLSIVSNTVCDGDHVSIAASGASSYLWAPLATANPTLNFTAQTGTSSYTCTATGSNGCKAKGYVTLTTTECTGISHKTLNDRISIFPNPAGDQVFIYTSIESDDLTIELTDLSGKIVLRQTLSFTAGNNTHSLSLTSLDNGVYFLSLRSKDQSQVSRLIKYN